ncbi:MAG TPA: O-antigen ligase family protein [Pirellulaceae bacterium]|nr:O-antigen ligase family protein [Pirellulaceae bacterium]HMP68738.1 O-antigen ligase family protein [Pirellulaceae bacterium]
MSTTNPTQLKADYTQPRSLVDWAFHLLNSDVRAINSALILLAMIVLNGADFMGADPERLVINWQIYMRLAICGIAGSYAIIYGGTALEQLYRFPGMLVLAFGVWSLICTPFAMDPRYSIAAVVSFFTAIVFVPVAIDQLGKHRFVVTVLIGICIYTAISWCLYLALPEIGTWREYISLEDAVERMGGLGHPNTLGLFVSAGFVIALALWNDNRLRLFEVLVIAAIWVLTIAFCLSRTSFLVAFIAAGAVLYHRARTREGVASISAVTLIIGLIVLVLAFTGEIDDLWRRAALAFSKSGDVSELTTATGRTEIWLYAIEQIEKRPLFGCGYGCARFAMVDHSFHSHNLVLNAGLMTGVVGMALVLMMVGVIFARLFNPSDAYVRGIAVLFLVGGTVESLIFEPAPTLPTILFLSLLFWPSERKTASKTPTPQIEPQH